MDQNSSSGQHQSQQQRIATEQASTDKKKPRENRTLSQWIEEPQFSQQLFGAENWIQQEELIESLGDEIIEEAPIQIEEPIPEQIKPEWYESVEEQIQIDEQARIITEPTNRHRDLRPDMRTTLADWLKEFAELNRFKKETFQLAVYYVEKYLSLSQNVPRNRLQLIGITALFISQKLEEVQTLRVQDIQRQTEHLFNIQSICETELNILRTLNYRLFYATPIFWLNLYTKLWDEMWDENNLILTFRSYNQESFANYTEACQILDCIVVDHDSITQSRRILSIAILYLIMGKRFDCFTNDLIVSLPLQGADILRDPTQPLNVVFENFLVQFQIKNQGVQLHVQDLEESIIYVSKYFILPINYEPHSCLQSEQFIDLTYEDILGFQIHNTRTLRVIEYISRYR